MYALDGAVRADDVYATVAIIMSFGRVPSCNGFVRGRGATESAPAFFQEAAVFLALRGICEWAIPLDRETIQRINIKAGDAFANYQICEWMARRRCFLMSSAASGSVHGIQHLQT